MPSPIQKNKLTDFFVNEGWLTKKGDRILTIASLLLIGTPLWLIYKDLINPKIGFFLLLLGIFLGAIVGYEGKAKQFGFQAPFTNDPLGWRKAKKSYETKEDSGKASKKGDPS